MRDLTKKFRRDQHRRHVPWHSTKFASVFWQSLFWHSPTPLPVYFTGKGSSTELASTNLSIRHYSKEVRLISLAGKIFLFFPWRVVCRQKGGRQNTFACFPPLNSHRWTAPQIICRVCEHKLLVAPKIGKGHSNLDKAIYSSSACEIVRTVGMKLFNWNIYSWLTYVPW